MNPRSTLTKALSVAFILANGTAFAQGNPTCCNITDFPNTTCPDIEPRADYTPVTNGCGGQLPDGGDQMLTPVIRAVGAFGSTQFADACNVHDSCYGTCQSGQTNCDQTFFSSLTNACVNTNVKFLQTHLTGTNPQEDKEFKDIAAMNLAGCTATAWAFYGAVVQLGSPSYNQGQTQGCNCCDDCYCAEVQCANGQTFETSTCTCISSNDAGVPASCTICPAPALETGGGVPEPPEGIQYVCQNAVDEGPCTYYTNMLGPNSGCYSAPNTSCTPCGAVASGNNCFLCPDGVYLATYSQYGCEEPATPDYGFPFVDYGDGVSCEFDSPSDVVSCEQVWP
jgi:hypothetical protein